MLMKVITLCENTATFGCLAEWGLCMYVETPTFTFLLDTGMTDVAIKNAARFNIDFSKIDAIILSHGHKDHTGGLSYWLPLTGPIEVVAHRDIFTSKFASRHTLPNENISIPYTLDRLVSLGAQFRFLEQPTEISPNVFVSGEVPMNSSFEQIDGGLLVKKNGKYEKDMLRDDLSVAIKTEKGLFVFLGCAHRGVVNIIRHFQQMTGEPRIYAIVGGLHLSRATSGHMDEVVAFFNDIKVQKIACSHCTGFYASMKLQKAFPDKFILNNSGKRLVFN